MGDAPAQVAVRCMPGVPLPGPHPVPPAPPYLPPHTPAVPLHPPQVPHQRGGHRCGGARGARQERGRARPALHSGARAAGRHVPRERGNGGLLAVNVLLLAALVWSVPTAGRAARGGCVPLSTACPPRSKRRPPTRMWRAWCCTLGPTAPWRPPTSAAAPARLRPHCARWASRCQLARAARAAAARPRPARRARRSCRRRPASAAGDAGGPVLSQ